MAGRRTSFPNAMESVMQFAMEGIMQTFRGAPDHEQSAEPEAKAPSGRVSFREEGERALRASDLKEGGKKIVRTELEAAIEKAERKLAAIPSSQRGVSAVINELAELYRRDGNLEMSADLFEEALEARRVALGHEDPETLVSLSGLGLVRREQNRIGEAEPLLVGALAMRRRVLGNEKKETLVSMHNLAMLRAAQDKIVEADELMAEAARGAALVLGSPASTPLTASFLAKSEKLHSRRLLKEQQETGGGGGSLLGDLFSLSKPSEKESGFSTNRGAHRKALGRVSHRGRAANGNATGSTPRAGLSA